MAVEDGQKELEQKKIDKRRLAREEWQEKIGKWKMVKITE